MPFNRSDVPRAVLLATALLCALAAPLRAQPAALFATDASTGDEFGNAVALSGAYALVGARLDDDAGDRSGAAYVFVRNGPTWTQQAKLLPDDGARSDFFGTSVGLSGDVAVVGAPGHNAAGDGAGAAYVFVRSGETWTQQAKLQADDLAALDNFGASVAVSGDYVLVGAIGGTNGDGDRSGVGYVFRREGEAWTQQAKLFTNDAGPAALVGDAAALDGEVAVLGAPDDDPNLDRSGAAYVFRREGETWTEPDQITPGDGDFEDEFGNAVAVSGGFIVVGMRLDDDAGESSGAAYVFAREGATWAQRGKLVAEDAAGGDAFGASVAVSGDVAVVGAPGSGSGGAAYVFTRDGATWRQTTRLTADDTAEGDELGKAVALDGLLALVAAPLNDDRAARAGAAYVFDLADTGTEIDRADAAVPSAFGLEPVFPNPAGPATTALFDLPRAAHVRLTVYDVLGREVARLVDGVLPAGRHTAAWQSGGVAGGVYLLRMQAGAFVAMQSVAVVK